MMAEEIGFEAEALAELAIVTTEPATNLAEHRTVDGEILASEIGDDQGIGIEIVARDRGPGIVDLRQALRDSNFSSSAMGWGLGAVRRLADEFDIHPRMPFAYSDPTGTDDHTTVVVAREVVP